MRGTTKLALYLACLFGICLALPGVANAGTFAMKQCLGSGQLDFQGSYMSVNGSDLVDAVNGCTTTGPGKIGVYQDRSGQDLSYGEGGQFLWSAPSGTRVIGTEFAARLKDANGIRAELIGSDGTRVTEIDGGVAHDGSQQVGSWSGSTRPQSFIAARIGCRRTNKCENQSSSAKAFMEVTDVEFTVQDTAPPSATASGELWSWSADSSYHHGSGSISVSASDRGSGISGAWAEVNGLRVNFSAVNCPGDKGSYATRFTPCPATFAGSRTLDTSVAPFQEGVNWIRVCVRDYASSDVAANRTCSALRKVLIDNQPSNPPVNLRSHQGAGWQPENGFELSWGIPDGQTSPITGAVYLLYELESGAKVAGGYFPGNGVTSGGPIEVPEVGAYRVVLYLGDGALNLGMPAETIVRFDDRPPGNVDPEPAGGWVSRDELPLEQEIERAEPGGPSGVSGYALTVSDGGPDQPCGGGICAGPEITLTGGADFRTGSIGGLGEGSHWISAAAVSGAHRSSVEPGSTLVRVDRTPPSSSISGVPNEWVNHPVTLTVEANDRLSGMRPVAGDEGEPETVIDADSYATYRAPGPIATFAVATEGVNRIRYWAEDLAGNANDGQPGSGDESHAAPGRALVRIDLTPPEVRFDPSRDPEDPEAVLAEVDDADSGVASASIGIRRAGSKADFKPLPTTGDGEIYRARIPSDDLAHGAYELAATVRDRAGNESTGNQTTSGQPMILNLPLKQPTRLSGILRKGRRSITTRYDSRRYAQGRLTSRGEALAHQTVQVVERFATGSRRVVRTRERTTDGDGRYRLPLAAGPSRTIEVRFGGTPKMSRADSPRLRLNVKGKVSFRIRPGKVFNGGTVLMKGRVGFKGALPPARGKLVAIQYLDPTRSKWRPVEVLRTDRRGRFRYRYRFRTISSAQRIVFRASALQEAGWPYLPSTAKPRSVIVYPKGRTNRKEAE